LGELIIFSGKVPVVTLPNIGRFINIKTAAITRATTKTTVSMKDDFSLQSTLKRGLVKAGLTFLLPGSAYAREINVQHERYEYS
jgi:RNase P subunit RPR2